MKNRYTLCLLLLVTVGLQSMESEVNVLPDWREKENVLAKHYKIFSEKNLNEYNGQENVRIDFNDFIKAGKEFGLSKDKTKESLKAIRLKDGNTIIHLLVMYKKNRELVQFAEQDMLFLEKNEQGLTAFDVAFAQFSSLFEEDPEDKILEFNHMRDERCLYLALLNYIKIKENADYAKEIEDEEGTRIWCCKWHLR